MGRHHDFDVRNVYHGTARAVDWPAFGSAVLRGHLRNLDGSCTCGYQVCVVHLLAHQHGIEVAYAPAR